MDIDLSSQRRGTTLFCYAPVLAEILLSTVPFHPLADGSLIPIDVDPQPIQSHCLATYQLSECPRISLD